VDCDAWSVLYNVLYGGRDKQKAKRTEVCKLTRQPDLSHQCKQGVGRRCHTVVAVVVAVVDVVVEAA
jgi:hypothetical protein